MVVLELGSLKVLAIPAFWTCPNKSDLIALDHKTELPDFIEESYEY